LGYAQKSSRFHVKYPSLGNNLNEKWNLLKNMCKGPPPHPHKTLHDKTLGYFSFVRDRHNSMTRIKDECFKTYLRKPQKNISYIADKKKSSKLTKGKEGFA